MYLLYISGEEGKNSTSHQKQKGRSSALILIKDKL
jgi:hypothetical protein